MPGSAEALAGKLALDDLAPQVHPSLTIERALLAQVVIDSREQLPASLEGCGHDLRAARKRTDDSVRRDGHLREQLIWARGSLRSPNVLGGWPISKAALSNLFGLFDLVNPFERTSFSSDIVFAAHSNICCIFQIK